MRNEPEQDSALDLAARLTSAADAAADKLAHVESAQAQAQAQAAVRASFDALYRKDASGRVIDRRGKQRPLSMAIGIGIAAALSVAGCASTPAAPNVPEVVRVKVSERARLPSWALDELDEHPDASQRVGDKLEAGEARRQTIRAENCRKRLLRRLDAGEDVDPKECGP